MIIFDKNICALIISTAGLLIASSSPKYKHDAIFKFWWYSTYRWLGKVRLGQLFFSLLIKVRRKFSMGQTMYLTQNLR